jgi:hypothetical protein
MALSDDAIFGATRATVGPAKLRWIEIALLAGELAGTFYAASPRTIITGA